jgi:hypothetical protein
MTTRPRPAKRTENLRAKASPVADMGMNPGIITSTSSPSASDRDFR